MSATFHRPHWHPTNEQRQFLIDTYATLTAVEQAGKLGQEYDAVCYQRQRLLRAGLVTRAERKYGRPYTRAEDDEIRAFVQDGKSVAFIARKLKRTRSSLVSHITDDLGGMATLRGEIGAMVRTTSQLGTLFGLNKATINKWIKRGWLKASRNEVFKTKTKQRMMLVTDADLIEFLQKREYWPAWSCATITDPMWKPYALQVRAAAGGEWVSMAAAAAQIDVPVVRLYAWYRVGKLARWTTLTYGVEIFLWSTDIERVRGHIRRTSCNVYLDVPAAGTTIGNEQHEPRLAA